jgi:hypothetical protein
LGEKYRDEEGWDEELSGRWLIFRTFFSFIHVFVRGNSSKFIVPGLPTPQVRPCADLDGVHADARREVGVRWRQQHNGGVKREETDSNRELLFVELIIPLV